MRFIRVVSELVGDIIVEILKHKGHEGNEGGLSDDCGSLFSIILKDGQKEFSTLSRSKNLYLLREAPCGLCPFVFKGFTDSIPR